LDHSIRIVRRVVRVDQDELLADQLGDDSLELAGVPMLVAPGIPKRVALGMKPGDATFEDPSVYRCGQRRVSIMADSIAHRPGYFPGTLLATYWSGLTSTQSAFVLGVITSS